jgi:hypothetical protein
LAAGAGRFVDRSAARGREYSYRLRAVGAGGGISLFGPIVARAADAAGPLAILAVAPNPTAGALRVEYATPRAGALRLQVLDLQGRRLATLVEGTRPAGRAQIVWTAAGGRDLGPGVYFLRLDSGGRSDVRRFAIAR